MIALGKFNLCSFRHVIPLMAGIIFTLFAILYWLGFFAGQNGINSVVVVNFFGFSAATTAILVSVIQIRKTHDWNRRHAATQAMNDLRGKIKTHSDRIDEVFGYYLRNENSPISVDDIHFAVCLKTADGGLVRCKTSEKWEVDPGKKEILWSLGEQLNLYEQLASGIHQGVYDKEVVADLMASSIIKVSKIFGPYIKHYNDDMYPSSQGRVWLNVKTLGAEFREQYRKDPKAKDRDKTG